MSPLEIHDRVDRWLAQHKAWVNETSERASLVEAWRVNVDDYGAAHPASTGCIIALVCEAWPAGCVVNILLDCTRVTPMGLDVPDTIERTSLAEALVAALEAAP